MTFREAVGTCLRKYATFSGRARRAEYWWFVAFIILGSIVTGILDGAIFGAGGLRTATGPGSFGAQVESSGPLGLVFSLGILIPAIAAGWRRMHDTGRSGLYLLYPLIAMSGIVTYASLFGLYTPSDSGPIPDFSGVLGAVLVVALIVLAFSPLLVIWWLTRPTQPGANRYGPEPAP